MVSCCTGPNVQCKRSRHLSLSRVSYHLGCILLKMSALTSHCWQVRWNSKLEQEVVVEKQQRQAQWQRYGKAAQI